MSARRWYQMLVVVVLALVCVSETADAQRGRGGGGRGGGGRGGGGGGFRGGGGMSARSVSRASVTRAPRAAVNRPVNRPIAARDIDVDVDVGRVYPYRPVARGAAAVAVGAAAASSCTTVVRDGVTYEECGNARYAPQFNGTSTEYVVVP